MLNGIIYGRVSGKDGAVNSLSPDLEELRYAVALGLVPLVMKDPCLPHYYSPGEFLASFINQVDQLFGGFYRESGSLTCIPDV